MKKEYWRPVRGYEELAEISNYGHIHRFERVYYSGKNLKTKRIQEENWTYGSENSDGYLFAKIGGTSKGVHQWVYMTFNDCDIPEGYEVNHIDEDKHNNCVWNLNLMSHGDNVRYGTGISRSAASRRGKKRPDIADTLRGKKRPVEVVAKITAALTNHPKKSKTVQALNPKTLEVIYEFPSTREAGRQGFDQSAVGKCCRGKRKSYKGFIWQYAL